MSTPTPIFNLKDEVGEHKIVYYSTASGGVISSEMHRIMSVALEGIPSDQIFALTTDTEVLNICPENLRGSSQCYGGIGWNSIDLENNIYNYTIRGNSGISLINIASHRSDTDVYVLPLQWAIDKAITNMTTTPNTMAFTSVTEQYFLQKMNRVYTKTLVNWLAPAIFLSMIGVIYHLTGVVALEREIGISNLLSSMGVTIYARVSSYFLSFTALYFPGWIVIGIALQYIVFFNSNPAITIFYHLLSGLSMVSYAIFLGTFFKSAQLAGIVSAGISVLLAIATTIQVHVSGAYANVTVYFLSFLFPPSNYSYFIGTISRVQETSQPINMIEDASGSNILLIFIFFAAAFQIFFFFGLAILNEQFIHGIARPLNMTLDSENCIDAIQIKNLTKKFKVGSLLWPKSRSTVVAVDDLSINVGQGQIFCLLGANGSGKTTTLEIVSGMQSQSSGNVLLAPGSKLGLCPQRNVLWDKMTVREHLEVWAGIKGVPKSLVKCSTEDLIGHCDLIAKATTLSKNLSGGQKRKLQLAIMFMGNSNVCCIDEVSSGLDPISRRKIWDIILSKHGSTSIILTTHFLDEADILSDRVAIMSKGCLKAEGSTVKLKETMGGGYRVFVENHGFGIEEIYELDSAKLVLEKIMELEAAGTKYRVAGPELEDVFLKVASADHAGYSLSSNASRSPLISESTSMEESKENSIVDVDVPATNDAKFIAETLAVEEKVIQLGFFGQCVAMLKKRWTIFKRSPLSEIATFAVPIIVAAGTRTFLTSFSGSGCTPVDLFGDQSFSWFNASNMSLVAGPTSTYDASTNGLNSFVSGIVSRFGGNITTTYVDLLLANDTRMVNSFEDFQRYVQANYSFIYPGGIYLDPPTVTYMIDGFDVGAYNGPAALNALDNMLMNGSVTLVTDFSPFQNPWTTTTGNTLQFVTYFGLAMSVSPAFISLYPTFERLSKVRAMQYSNGLRILPLWSAYAFFSFVVITITAGLASTIIGTSSSSIIGVGYLFLSFLLYGLASILLSFIVSLYVESELAAFAVAAAIQAVYFLLYLIAYLCVLAYGTPSTIGSNLLLVNFSMSVIVPTASLIRALFVSLNLFGVLCNNTGQEISYLGDITAYGGPIAYLIVQSIVFYLYLIWWESGKYRLSFGKLFSRMHTRHTEEVIESRPAEVLNEISCVEDNPGRYENGLRLLHVTKTYNKVNVVDDITFGVEGGECFAVLGRNGAGKTTTFNMIRGEAPLTSGEIFVNGISAIHDRTHARTMLGVCPQFDAMDRLTVEEVLKFYCQLRGLKNTEYHVEKIIEAVGIVRFRNRLASKLSGGNKRKLSLGVALIGNPPVLLLDEPSSGMDAFAKRIMWRTLAGVSHGRSIVLTTHSMEEADALASRAGFLNRRMLTVGRTDYLRELYGKAYHVHIVCKSAPHTSRGEMQSLIRWIQWNLPGSSVGDRAYQGQIKLSVPVERNGKNASVSDIFKLFEENKDNLGIESYSVASTTLEEVFLAIAGRSEEGDTN